MEGNFGVERNLPLQRPLPGCVGISNFNFKRKKLTKYHCSLNIWFLHNIVKSHYAFGTLSGIHFTAHDVVKPSCTNHINIVCKTTTSYMLREGFGYNRVVFVCPWQASYMLRLKISLFTKFVTKIGLGMTPALTPEYRFFVGYTQFAGDKPVVSR